SGVGRSSARATANSSCSLKRSIARLPQLLQSSVQPGAGVRLRDPDNGADLRVGQPGEELERDQLTLPRRQLAESGRQEQSRLSLLCVLLRSQLVQVNGLRG